MPRIAGISAAATLRRSPGSSDRCRAPPKAGLAPGALVEPFDGAVDDVDRGVVAAPRVVAPGEEAVAFQHHALRVRVVAAELPEPEAELVARALPRQPADLVAEDLLRQRLRVLRGGDGDDRVGVHVVDVGARHVGVQRRVNRGGARVEGEGAVGQVAHHLVLEVDAAVEALQRLELRRVEGGEAVEPDGADVAARALDPEHLDRLAGERVGLRHLGRGVAAAVVGDALVRAEQIRAVEQQLRLAHPRGPSRIPEVLQQVAGLKLEHRPLPCRPWPGVQDPRGPSRTRRRLSITNGHVRSCCAAIWPNMIEFD